ncbi:MAG: hypothetical protein ACRD0P_33320 [Stackebrandtia sp.]
MSISRISRRYALGLAVSLGVGLSTGALGHSEVPENNSGPLCGASFAAELPGETYQQALTRVDGYYGGLESVRVFYPGLPRMWPGKLDTGGRPMIVSFKADPVAVLAGTHDDFLRTWFQTAPSDQEIFWTYFHEPENDVDAGAFTAEQFRRAWIHIASLARPAGHPRLHATVILMGWSVDPASGRDWLDYYPGREHVDVLGWDLYNSSWRNGRYKDPEELFTRVVDTSRTANIPFGIAETGSPLVAGDDGRLRADWLRALGTHLTQSGAVFIEYFDNDRRSNGGPDYRLRDPFGMAAWREFCDVNARR